MKKNRLEGTWKMTVTYGQAYGRLYTQELFCSAELTQNTEAVTGVIYDTGGVGMNPGKATIHGTYKDGVLKFIKQYESLHTLNPDNGIEIDRSQKGRKIFYEATYDQQNDSFVGTWHYKNKLFGFITIGTHGNGTWTMVRE